MSFTEIKTLLDSQGSAMESFANRTRAELEELRTRLDGNEAKANRARLFGGTPSASIAPAARWIDTKSGNAIPVLGAEHKFSDLHAGGHDTPSLGRVLRGLVLGGRAPDAAQLAEERKSLSMAVDPSGGYTVGGALAGQWIDRLRAAMVLSRAGVTTVPVEGRDLTIARLDTDPTVSWHGENAALPASDPNLGAVTLRPKTVVALVKLSLELAQDSANIEEILATSLTGALATAIDQAGLVGVTTDAAAAPGGIFDLSGRNTVTGVGAPTSWDWAVDAMYELLADNVPQERIGALIGHPAIWKFMRKLKTGIASDNTPLSMPDEVAKLLKLWTTSAPLDGSTAKAVIGDWSNLLWGIRQDISVRVLSEAYLGSNLQLAVLAYARCDFAAARPQGFCTIEGISV